MKAPKILVASLTATAVMSVFMLLAQFVVLPTIDQTALLGTMFGGNKIAGWVVHFAIGTLMALPYVYFFNRWIPAENRYLRGTLYGIIVFVFSEIVFNIMNLKGWLNYYDQRNMALMVLGNAVIYMIYGTVLGAFFERAGADGFEQAKHNEPKHNPVSRKSSPANSRV
jgi:hypothetical protein